LTAEPRSPDAKNGWYRTRPAITLAVSDADPAATAHYSWDGADFRAYTGPFKPPEGNHTLRFFAQDTRGNKGNESFRVFKVDSVAPVTAVSIDPPGMVEEWYRETPSIFLSNSENAEIWYWWDGGAPLLYGGPVSAQEGEHELGYQSRDAAGNTEKARTALFKVDTSPPEARLSVTNTSLILGDILGADASESSDANGIEAYSIDFGDGYRRSGPARSWDHQYDAPGTYSIVLKVRDVSGQWSEPVSANVTVSLPPRPPAAPSTASSVLSQSTLMAAAVAVLVIGIVSVAAMRRRRGAP
jgi:hypothetical protein